jgi:hypothetical protein
MVYVRRLHVIEYLISRRISETHFGVCARSSTSCRAGNRDACKPAWLRFAGPGRTRARLPKGRGHPRQGQEPGYVTPLASI